MARRAIPKKVEEAKQRIITAAFDIAAAEGLSQFTLSKVAAKAGITKAGIYWYFESKEALLNEMALVLREAFAGPARGALQGQLSAKERMEFLVNALSCEDRLRDCTLILKIYFEAKENYPFIKSVIQDGYREFLAIVTAVFEEGIKNGELKTGMGADCLARFFVASLDACVIQGEMLGNEGHDLRTFCSLFFAAFDGQERKEEACEG